MSDEKLLQSINKTLDNSIEHLDAATLSKLNQARQKAQVVKHRSPIFWNWLPATGLATITIAVLAGYLWNSQVQSTDQIVVSTAYDDLEILSSNTELDLLEDIDFVTWLIDEDAS